MPRSLNALMSPDEIRQPADAMTNVAEIWRRLLKYER
jgi:hypothetical protein